MKASTLFHYIAYPLPGLVLALLLSGAVNAASSQGVLEVDLRASLCEDHYKAMSFRKEQWFDSTFWTGPGWTRVGRNWQHPGHHTPSVRTFIAPESGSALISGRVFKADTNKGGGDGIRAFIRHNEALLWQESIAGDDSQGATHQQTLRLNKGDKLRFVIDQRGAIAHDTTYWDPLIAYEQGASYQASEGFLEAPSCDSPWRYETELLSEAEIAPASVHLFTKDLYLESIPLDKASVSIQGLRYLPYVVLAGRGDVGGKLLALPDAQSNWSLEVGAPNSLEKSTVSWRTLNGIAPEVLTYAGGWSQAFTQHAAWKSEAAYADFEAVYHQALQEHAALDSLEIEAMHPGLWALVSESWLREDKHPDSPRALLAAARKHLDSALLLTARLEESGQGAYATRCRSAIMQLRAAAAHAAKAPSLAQAIYVSARRLKRAALLHRPEMNFDQLLFTKRVPTSYSHLVMQYYGWRARPGGGLFVLEKPGYSLHAQDILAGRLASGSVLEPSLDYAGKKIVFSFVENAGASYTPTALDNERDEGFFHLYSVNVDGTEFTQLTQGAFEDLMPVWLPDGGVAFCSTRRKGYARCFGAQFSPRWDTYTLHRMEADGSELITLSYNDVSEWFPSVANDGMILYSRWDYIDRDAVTHQNLWSTRPDGANPAAVWGNGLPNPHCTFQMKAIPESQKLIFVASAHHSVTGGSLVLLDPTLGENAVEAMTRLTPEIPFPEAETREIKEWYAAPWPLAEDLYLTAYSPWPLVWEPGANRHNGLGIYVLDDQGNRELIYRDPAIGATNPIPLHPRPKAPVIASNCDPKLGDEAVFYVADVYDGLQGVVERGAVKALRVVQIFPKNTPVANTPPIGLAGEENGRAILGTVPVAEDGSVHFKAPARKALLFQLLDAQGCAVQTMRSLTYAQPGERVSCVGCHEGRGKASQTQYSLAGRREAEAIRPGKLDGAPFSFATMVQPVLDKHCIQCHVGEKAPHGKDLTGTPDREFSKAYWSLCGDIPYKGKGGTTLENAARALVPRYWQRNQIQITAPGGAIGARGSRLMKMLRKGHHKVKLSEEEFQRLAAWIDSNAIFYGENRPEQQALQLAGKQIPMPELQ